MNPSTPHDGPKPRIAILVGGKGRGSNMAALIDACQSGKVDAEVAIVVAPSSGTPASELALSGGVAVAVASPKLPEYGEKLIDILQSAGATWICLAGYMTLLPMEVLNAFPNRVLNVHPALLPKYGGKGMYGLHVHEAVLAAHECESGCTVHYVNGAYDEGEIILQLQCPVHPDDTPEALAARVLVLEHQAYPTALAYAISRDS